VRLAFRSAIGAIVLAGCSACTGIPSAYRVSYVETKGVGKPDDILEAPAWGVGLATPVEVFVFPSRQNAPTVCSDSGQLMRSLRDSINGDHSDNTCKSTISPSLDGTKTLNITCTARLLSNGCVDMYSATLWAEYERSSTVDYRILAFSWVRRVCPVHRSPGPFGITDDQALRYLLDGQSTKMAVFFKNCSDSRTQSRTP